jgi:flagellar protein FlaG
MEAAMIDNVVGRDALPAALANGEAAKTVGAQASERPAQGKQVESSPESPAVDRKAIEQAAAKIQESIVQVDASLKIEIDSDIHRVVVKVINNQSGEVIRQIPSQEMVEIAKRLDAIQGLLFTKRT